MGHRIFSGIGGQMDFIKAGKAKPLVVLAPKRSAFAPEVPSLGDLGMTDVDGTGWTGALVPAATPAPAVARLNREFVAALQADGMTDDKFQAIVRRALPTISAPRMRPRFGSASTFTYPWFASIRMDLPWSLNG